jgi:hypothetical protein
MATKPASKPTISRTAPKGRPSVKKTVPIALKKLQPIAKVSSVTPAGKSTEIKTPAATKGKASTKADTKKIKKTKLVRDSFTIPRDEYLALQTLKERAIRLAKAAKKGELLRAGLLALTKMTDSVFLSTLAAIPSLKTGRPKSAKKSGK